VSLFTTEASKSCNKYTIQQLALFMISLNSSRQKYSSHQPILSYKSGDSLLL